MGASMAFGWLPVILGVCIVAPQSPAGPEASIVRAKRAYARAVELEAQKNDTAALSLLWEAAGLAPRNPDIQNRLGEALERIGALEAAIAAYRVAVSASPDARKLSNNLILALVRGGQGPEAVERARALITLAPDDPDRYFTLGLAQSEQDVNGALATFRRVLELAPRHTLARYNLALVLKRSDRLSDALEELDRALAIEPRPEAYYTQGVIYWHQGDLERAVRALREAVAAEPRYAEAYFALGSVLKAKRDWPGAVAALRRAIVLRPDLPAGHYTLGQVLRLRGDEKAAGTALDHAERLRRRGQLDQEATVWTSVGTQKLDAGDLPGALALFRRAISVSDGYAPAYYQMGRTLQRLGEDDASRRAFARAAQLNPSLLAPRNP